MSQMGTDGSLVDVRQCAIVYPHQELTHGIIGAAMAVHNELGSGFLEKVYEKAMVLELDSRGVGVATQVPINISYKGEPLGTYVADMVVSSAVLCELKAVDQLTSIHQNQVLHYLKATRLPIGLLLNFGASRLEIKRLIL